MTDKRCIAMEAMVENKSARYSSAISAWARQELRQLQEDYHDYNSSTVPTLSYPTSTDFAKQVAKGIPCVYDTSCNADTSKLDGGSKSALPWAAMHWTVKDLIQKVRDPIEVATTPHGNADALIPHPFRSPSDCQEQIFVQPASTSMSMADLIQKLTAGPSSSDPVYYLQSQDSNLTTVPSLAPLLSDLSPSFSFATPVLGEPDARNIWIGDDRSVTSLHRDPYENLYLVLKGSKIFRLFAPVDEVDMPVKWVATGRYVVRQPQSSNDFEKGELGFDGFDVEMDNPCSDDENEQRIPWIDLDPLSIPASSLLHGRMRTVTVKAGQILYLPSGWYHHVTQRCGLWDDGFAAPCIAVNYWYDMDYEGERYVTRQMMGRLVKIAKRETTGNAEDSGAQGHED